MKFTLPKLPKVNLSCLNPIVKAIEKHGPDIMIGLGITGLLGTVFMTANIAPKADRKLKRKEFQKGEELTKTEAVKEVWRDFVPVIILAAVSTTAIVLGTKELHKRTAAITALCTLAETSLADYKKSTLETVGEEVEKDISQKVEEKRIERIQKDISESDGMQVINSHQNLEPFYDLYAGRPFYGREADIERALKRCLEKISKEQPVSLNDFYYELGHPGVEYGKYIGWSRYTQPLDIHYGSMRDNNGVARSTINFKYDPVSSFNEYSI